MDVPGIGEIEEVSTFETVYGIEPMANKVEHNSSSRGSSKANELFQWYFVYLCSYFRHASSSTDASPDSYYNSFFGIDLQIVQVSTRSINTVGYTKKRILFIYFIYLFIYLFIYSSWYHTYCTFVRLACLH